MGRKILSIVAGLIAGIAVISIIQYISTTVNPAPEGLDFKDKEAVRAFVQSMPTSAIWLILLSHILGAFAAGLVGAMVAQTEKMKTALILGFIFLLFGILNLVMVPGHPTWFAIADILIYIPMALLGAALFTNDTFSTASNTTINKPVKEVWDFFENSDNMKLWLKGFQEFIPLSGKQGEVGATSKHVYLEKGRKFEMIEEITEKVPYKSFSGKLTASGMESSIETHFEEEKGATELTFNVNTTFTSIMYKIMGIFMKKEFKKRQDADMAALKSILEKS